MGLPSMEVLGEHRRLPTLNRVIALNTCQLIILLLLILIVRQNIFPDFICQLVYLIFNLLMSKGYLGP